MRTVENDCGFRVVLSENTINDEETRLLGESSAYGHFLWIGQHHHLDRGDVLKLIAQLQHWLDNKRLPPP